MAKAPNPKNRAPKQTIEITVRGERAVVNPEDFGARDDALVRRETKAAGVGKLSLMGALNGLDEGSVGLDSICLLWWLARRKKGDTDQSYAAALDAFPSYGEAAEVIDFHGLDDDDEDGSPED